MFNSKRLRSDALIGSFDCDCGTVYDMNRHTVLNKWLLLSDPEEGTGVRGYLKICMAILGPGDEAPVSTQLHLLYILCVHFVLLVYSITLPLFLT